MGCQSFPASHFGIYPLHFELKNEKRKKKLLTNQRRLELGYILIFLFVLLFPFLLIWQVGKLKE